MKRSLSPRVALRFWFRFRLLQAGQQRSYQKRLLPFHPILLPALRPELVLALCFALIRFNQERKERVFLYVPGLSDHLAPDLPLPAKTCKIVVGEPRFRSRARRCRIALPVKNKMLINSRHVRFGDFSIVYRATHTRSGERWGYLQKTSVCFSVDKYSVVRQTACYHKIIWGVSGSSISGSCLPRLRYLCHFLLEMNVRR